MSLTRCGSERGPSASSRAISSSKTTIERLCCGPSNSATARASASWAACTSAWSAAAGSAGAGCWAKAASGTVSRSAAAASARARARIEAGRFEGIVVAGLTIAQHALGAVVVDENRSRGVEGERAGLAQLRAGDGRDELALRVEDEHARFLVGHVEVAERVDRDVDRALEPGGADAAQQLAAVVPDPHRLLVAVERHDPAFAVEQDASDLAPGGVAPAREGALVLALAVVAQDRLALLVRDEHGAAGCDARREDLVDRLGGRPRLLGRSRERADVLGADAHRGARGHHQLARGGQRERARVLRAEAGADLAARLDRRGALRLLRSDPERACRHHQQGPHVLDQVAG